MRRTRVVIQRHQALSSRCQPAPCYEWCVWRYLLGYQPSKPLFRPVWQLEAEARTCQRQRGYKAVAVPVLEAALHPSRAVGNTTSSICQQLDVAKRCLIRGVKWHVSPRISHCLNDTTRLAKRNKITSQRRGCWRTGGACRALPHTQADWRETPREVLLSHVNASGATISSYVNDIIGGGRVRHTKRRSSPTQCTAFGVTQGGLDSDSCQPLVLDWICLQADRFARVRQVPMRCAGSCARCCACCARRRSALHIGFHQQRQYGLRYGSQEIAVTGLLQQFGQRQFLLGHLSRRRAFGALCGGLAPSWRPRQ